MKTFLLAPLFALSPVLATAQDTLIYGTIEYGILEPDTVLETVPLEPGETVIGIYPAPPVVQRPLEDDIVYETIPYTPPDQDIDRVTGLPRNTPGWTGDAAQPAGIGCFPQGVCAHLN